MENNDKDVRESIFSTIKQYLIYLSDILTTTSKNGMFFDIQKEDILLTSTIFFNILSNYCIENSDEKREEKIEEIYNDITSILDKHIVLKEDERI